MCEQMKPGRRSATLPLEIAAISNSGWVFGRASPAPQRRCRPAANERQIEIGLDAGFGAADVRYGIYAMHGGCHDAAVSPQTFRNGSRMQTVEARAYRRIAENLHVEMGAARAECPGGIEMFFPHEPIRAHRDEGSALHGALPGKAVGGHPPGRDGTDGRSVTSVLFHG